MANNKAVFELIVDDKGRLKLATKDVASLGSAVEKTKASHERGEKAARNYHNTQEKGIIGTANGTKSFSKLRETIGSGDAGLVGAYATLAAHIFTVSAAFNALRNAAQAEQVMLGLEAAGARAGNTLTILAGQVKSLTNGALSMEQAARATAQVTSAGFGSAEMLKLTQVANDASFALGRNLPDAMERVTRGVTKLEPELLDELGIMVRLDDAVNTYAVQLGRSASSLSNFERRQAFLNAVAEEGERKFGGLSAAAGDTRGYDNLAAAFDDLSKSSLGMLNDALLPIANFLGGNSNALSTLLILFAGTIASKVAPSLMNLGNNSLAAAERLKRTTNATASLLKQVNGVPKSFIVLTDKIKEGTASLKDYEKTLKEMDKSIVAKEGYLANPTKSMNVPLKSLELEGVKKQREELQNVIAASYRYKAARTGANAAIVASEITLLNITRQIPLTFALIKRSFESYHRAAIIANAGVATSFTRVIALANTARVAIVAAGSALLTFIPIIGQIYAVYTILEMAFKYIKETFFDPKGLKEYNAQVATLEEIASKAFDKRLEYVRLQKETLNVSGNEISKNILIGNSINELVSQMEKAIEARRRLNAEINKDPSMNPKSLKDSFEYQYSGLDKVARVLNLFTDTELIKAKKNNTPLFKTEEFKTVESLYTLGFDKLTERTDKFAKSINNLPWKEQQRRLGEYARGIQKDFGPLSAISNDLRDSMNELETSTSKLLTSSKISTPFDDQVRSLDSLVSGIARYNIEIVKGTATTEELSKILTGMGGQTMSLLSVDAQNARNEFMRLNSEVLKLESSLRKAREENRGSDVVSISKELKAVRGQRNQSIQGLRLIETETSILREKTIELQRQTREFSSQLALVQSQHSTVSSLYGRTAQGLRLQIEQEEKVRSLKVAQLQLEKSFIDSSIARQKQELETLKLKEANLKLTVLEYETWLKATGEYDKYKASILELGLSIDSITSSIRDQESASRNLANQQQAINNENLTEAQKQARYQQRNIELVNEYNSALQEQSNIVQDLNLSIRKIERIRSGSIATVRQEFEDLKSTAQQQVAMLESTTSRRIASLRGDLEIARADAAKLGSQTYASEQVAVLESQIANEEILLQARVQQISVTNQLQMLEKARFDVTKEGLEWQQKSLEYMERELDISRQTQDAQNRIFDARRQINLKKSGLADTEESRRAQEIRVATANYNLALQEVQIKEALIDLEYGLLDAQRLALAEELKARAEILGPNSRAYGQLQNTIKLLEKGSYTALAESQKRAARLGVEAMRAELENLVTLENPWGGNNGPLSFFMGLKDLGSAMSAAQGVLKKSIDSGTKIITDLTKDNSLPDVDVPTITRQELLKPPLESLVGYVKEIRDFIQGQIAETSSLSGNIKTAVDFFLSKGWTKEQAAAIVGNLQVESGLNTRAVGDNGKAFGIAQWRKDAAAGARALKFREVMGVDVLTADLMTQLKFIQWELENTYKKAGNALKATRDYASGATVVDKQYEQSAGLHTARRVAEAKKIYDSIGGASSSAPVQRNSSPQPVVYSKSIAVAANDNEIASRDRSKISADMNNRGGIEETIQGASQLGNLNIPEVSSATQMWGTQLQLLNQHMSVTLENLAQLGPEGQILSAVIQGSQQMYAAILAVGKAGSSTSEQMTAWGGVASAALSMINGVVQASANARVAAIDREIDAEQRRDGKSAESVAKIQAMEKRKDQIAKKAFDTNKKIMMAQAIIATATGVAQALSYGPPGIPLAIAIGALGAAQLAIIAGTSYQSTASKTATAANIGKITVGRRGSEIDLAKPNKSPGGEIGYLRGTQGYGTNSSNYTTVGRAYGGGMPQMVVGEKGPEKLDLAIPMRVKPLEANDNQKAGDTYQFNIQALDAKSVEELFMNNGGSLIASIRSGANASGQPFLEGVSVPQLKSAAGGGTKY